MTTGGAGSSSSSSSNSSSNSSGRSRSTGGDETGGEASENGAGVAAPPVLVGDLFAGAGELRERCRAFDWATTPLGPVEGWPPALRTAVRLMLASPVATSLWCGPAYTLVYNDAYRRILGVKHPGALGRSGAAVWDELWPALEAQFEQVRAGGPAVYAEETRLTMERLEGGRGEDAWFTYALSAVTDESGACLAVYNVAVEITDRVRARVEAEAARRRSEAVLASIADAFYLLDREWRFIYVNDAAEPLLQTTRERLLGRTLWEAFPGVVGSEFELPYREAMATGRTTSAEAYFAPLGTWFDVRTYSWAEGLMVHFRDVGARKAAEAERERLLQTIEIERARLYDVFRRAPSFIVAFRGPEQVYEFVNEAYYQLVGHREIIGKPLLDALPEIRGQGFDELLERVRQTGEPWVGRETPVVLQRTPGAALETRYLDMVFQALAEADGTRSGVVVHGSDVTEHVLARREVERLLGESERARGEAEAARREAEAANRAKSEFLATMSHELRTPLNAISGYAELMEMGIRGPVTAQQLADLRRIRASQLHLLGLVNEVLNYARIETGTVRYEVTDVPLAALVASVEPLVAPQLASKGLSFSHDGCAATPLVARADREKARQVLLNLLSNAVKFTDAPGTVEVSCEAATDRVMVRVRDTGIGIAAAEIDRVFEPFVQVNASLTRTHEGTGLGLAISRDLARGMGGDLTVVSEPGVGSTFTLSLPRA